MFRYIVLSLRNYLFFSIIYCTTTRIVLYEERFDSDSLLPVTYVFCILLMFIVIPLQDKLWQEQMPFQAESVWATVPSNMGKEFFPFLRMRDKYVG